MNYEVPEELRPLVEGIGQGGNQETQDLAARATRVSELKDAEALRARRDAAWHRRMEPVKLAARPSTFAAFGPRHPCDRCGHEFRYHTGPDRGSVCMIAEGRVWRGALEKRPRATKCWCDGYVAAA